MFWNWKKWAALACGLGAALALSGCGGAPVETEPVVITLPTAPPQTQPETTPMELVEELTVELKAGEVYTLDQYPNLKAVDFAGSDCYDAILHYIESHPQVDVTYRVDLGGTAVPGDAASATVEPGAFTYEALMENLQYLPQLTALTLPDISLSVEQVRALQEAYPALVLDYTVELLGTSYPSGTTELDLTAMGSGQTDQVVARIGLLTQLQSVSLSSELTMREVAALQAANPGAVFRYSFTLFGQTISTADTEVVYKNHAIGNEGEAQIRQALEILNNCQRFVLDNCGIDYEVLAGIREDFRDGPKVVWRVYFGVDGRYNALTDQETIRAVYNVTDSTCSPLQYCEDVKYMDIGHNEYLTDLSFVGHMPNIEALIASGCAATELVGFDNCKKLVWLELAYCYKLEDVDCLAGCESLTYLNLSYSKVKSYEMLDTLPLQRFVCLSPKASTEEQNTFISIHPKPGCITVFYGYSNPYGYGWRYDDNGKTYNEYYKTVIREVFNLDYLESLLPDE